MRVVESSAKRPAITRDRFTWVAYLLLGYFAYLQSLQGPIMPFLRSELQLSYVMGSLHLSTSAAGMVLLGLFGDRIVQWLGLRRALWGGAIGISVGAALLAIGSHVAITILATCMMGMIGTLLLIAQQSSLGHHQQHARAIAFTEANIVASLCALLAPLAVGAAVELNLGWRVALLLPFPLQLLLILREGCQPVPTPPSQAHTAASARLPRRFRLFWAVACLGVAGEWSVGFWGADYLHSVVGLPIEQAVTALSLFFVAMLLGRIIGSRLAHTIAPVLLLSGALVIGTIGVLLLWLAAMPLLSLIGLGLAGLGIGNLYPLSLAVAVETAPRSGSGIDGTNDPRRWHGDLLCTTAAGELGRSGWPAPVLCAGAGLSGGGLRIDTSSSTPH
ncbi:MAG: hypothetical protein Fur005_43610 [Roseiflexaceae bacterium]